MSRKLKVLFLDDMHSRHKAIAPHLLGFNVDYVWDYEEAITALTARDYDILMLDHDLSLESIMGDPDDPEEMNGTKVAEWIVENKTPEDFIQIICHSLNPSGRANMVRILKEAGFKQAINYPFIDILAYLRNKPWLP